MIKKMNNKNKPYNKKKKEIQNIAIIELERYHRRYLPSLIKWTLSLSVKASSFYEKILYPTTQEEI